LAWDESTQTFTARVQRDKNVSAKDDFSANLRVGVSVTHKESKKLIGRSISSSFEYTVDTDMREEDKCKVKFLKMDWTSASSKTATKDSMAMGFRRLQMDNMELGMETSMGVDSPVASVEPVVDLGTFAPVTTPDVTYPEKTSALTPRQKIEGETLEFLPGESFTMPKFVQKDNCGWTQTVTSKISPSNSDIEYRTENG